MSELLPLPPFDFRIPFDEYVHAYARACVDAAATPSGRQLASSVVALSDAAKYAKAMIDNELHGEGGDCLTSAWDMLTEALAAIPAAASGWQDMATAPRDGTSVTVCGPASGPPQTAFFDVGGWQVWVYQLTGLQVRGEPTHWMPLPEPPK